MVFWGLKRPQTFTDLPTYLTTYVGYIRRATKPTVSVPVMWNSIDNKCPITLGTIYVPIMQFGLVAKYVIFTK